MSECASCLKERLRGREVRIPRRTHNPEIEGSNPSPSTRVPVLQREKATFIKLRRQGYTISTIARAFGRSTSVIYRYIRNAYKYGTLQYLDFREKISPQQRQLSKAQRWVMIMCWLPQWTKWILGEEDKPP